MMLQILKWSELWAPLLPVVVWLIRKPKDHLLKPVKIYIVLVLGLYLWMFSAYFGIIDNNHFIYTLISICRLVFFAWFFSLLNVYVDKNVFSIILLFAFGLIIINFLLLEDFFTAFSSDTFSLEGIILLIFCIRYFLHKLRSDEIDLRFDSTLYIVTGLSVYEAVCFPVFLFYRILIENNDPYASMVWNIVHNITYIVFCLFIARAFYGATQHTTN